MPGTPPNYRYKMTPEERRAKGYGSRGPAPGAQKKRLPSVKAGILVSGGQKRGSGKTTTYRAKHCDVIYDLFSSGRAATVMEAADAMALGQTTLYKWRKQHPAFADAIRRGKDDFNCKDVEKCMLKRCMGYEYDETTRELCGQDGAQLKTTKIVTKHVPPSDRLIQYFLNNRSSRWQDKRELSIDALLAALTQVPANIRLAAIAEIQTQLPTPEGK